MDTAGMDSLLAQMRVAKAMAQGAMAQGAMEQGGAIAQPVAQPGKVDFANALKTAIDGVAKAQSHSEEMRKAFVMGDERASLSDTLIAMQKSSINFQMAVQVRNRVVQAYNDVMNMQV